MSFPQNDVGGPATPTASPSKMCFFKGTPNVVMFLLISFSTNQKGGTLKKDEPPKRGKAQGRGPLRLRQVERLWRLLVALASAEHCLGSSFFGSLGTP